MIETVKIPNNKIKHEIKFKTINSEVKYIRGNLSRWQKEAYELKSQVKMSKEESNRTHSFRLVENKPENEPQKGFK